MITPAQVEKRLYDLSKEIDEAHEDLVNAESGYHRAVSDYEIAMAKSRMSNSQADLKMTAQMREDQALIENETRHYAVSLAEAQVKAARANANRLKTQVDIARSISVSVRSEMTAS
jgi:multidrug resistance efflux pump